jgi:hypothetical protein
MSKSLLYHGFGARGYNFLAYKICLQKIKMSLTVNGET